MSGLFAGTSLERPVTCERCGKPLDECACPRDAAGNVVLPGDQSVRVQREKRRGQWVTVVRGLDPDATDRKALASELRKRFATGGSVTGEGIELQGDHRDAVVEHLRSSGYTSAKASGG